MSIDQWGWWHRLRVGLAYLNGDAGYADYRRHCQLRHPDRQPMDRRAYYLDCLQRRYKGVNRCC